LRPVKTPQRKAGRSDTKGGGGVYRKRRFELKKLKGKKSRRKKKKTHTPEALAVKG